MAGVGGSEWLAPPVVNIGIIVGIVVDIITDILVKMFVLFLALVVVLSQPTKHEMLNAAVVVVLVDREILSTGYRTVTCLRHKPTNQPTNQPTYLPTYQPTRHLTRKKRLSTW